jgi:hypothetical protein
VVLFLLYCCCVQENPPGDFFFELFRFVSKSTISERYTEYRSSPLYASDCGLFRGYVLLNKWAIFTHVHSKRKMEQFYLVTVLELDKNSNCKLKVLLQRLKRHYFNFAQIISLFRQLFIEAKEELLLDCSFTGAIRSFFKNTVQILIIL